MHLEMKQEVEVHFLVGTVILEFLSIFKKSKASSPFEALNSMCLSRCQSDVIPPVQMRRRPTAFSRVSTGDSDILHLVTLNRSLNLFHCREIRPSLSQASCGIFHLKQKAQSPSHLPIAEGKPLEVLVENWLSSSKTGNQLSS